MKINRIREQRRKELSNKETDDMVKRYSYECSPIISRKATPEEMNKMGDKTREKEHKMFLRKNIGTY